MSEPVKEPRTAKEAITEVFHTIKAIVVAPKIIQGINIPYFLEGVAYWGVLTVLAKFLHDSVQLSDPQSGYIMGLLTGGITLAMFILGGVVDKIGIRRAMGIALGMMIIGRGLLGFAAGAFGGGGMWSPMFFTVCVALLFIVVAYGLYQPGAYAAIAKYTTPKTAAMGYAMLYALMNFGGFFCGVISPPVRRNFGFSSIFWLYAILTSISLVILLFLVTKKNEAQVMDAKTEKLMTDDAVTEKKEGEYEKQKVTFTGKVGNYFKEHPFRDIKFVYFIFILIPVQTLFAHQWLTVPLYIDRAFAGTAVGENFEFFANLNPLIIFIAAPLVAAFTSRVHTYKMMVLGTTVMALPTFLLAFGPNPTLLITYILIMSIGEAMWQPRFLQWISQIAPPGKVGAYQGIGQFPWFLTKFITASYSGWFLAHYCPSDGAKNTETLWLIYGCVALITPVALIITRNWAGKSDKMDTGAPA